MNPRVKKAFRSRRGELFSATKKSEEQTYSEDILQLSALTKRRLILRKSIRQITRTCSSAININ